MSGNRLLLALPCQKTRVPRLLASSALPEVQDPIRLLAGATLPESQRPRLFNAPPCLRVWAHRLFGALPLPEALSGYTIASLALSEDPSCLSLLIALPCLEGQGLGGS